MKRLALMVFLLWAIFAMMIATARRYGEAHPGPDKLAELGFGVCGGNPCFLGITPDVTTWAEAKRTLSQSSKFTMLVKDDGTEVISDHFGQAIIYVRQPENAYVGSITVFSDDVLGTNPHIPASAADIVALYGLPCNVQIAIQGKSLRLNYSAFLNYTIQVDVLSDHRYINATSFASAIYLISNQAFAWPPCEGHGYTTSWLGFSSMSNYEAKLNNH
jgi:hypothetical protein